MYVVPRIWRPSKIYVPRQNNIQMEFRYHHKFGLIAIIHALAYWIARGQINLQPQPLDFLKRPSLLISGSSGRPARKGLLSLAACQIYRRNFPPVDFIQSETVLLTCHQSNWLTPHETWVRDWAVLIKAYRGTSFDRSVFTVYYTWPEFNCKAEYSDYRNQVFIVLVMLKRKSFATCLKSS